MFQPVKLKRYRIARAPRAGSPPRAPHATGPPVSRDSGGVFLLDQDGQGLGVAEGLPVAGLHHAPGFILVFDLVGGEEGGAGVVLAGGEGVGGIDDDEIIFAVLFRQELEHFRGAGVDAAVGGDRTGGGSQCAAGTAIFGVADRERGIAQIGIVNRFGYINHRFFTS